MARYTAGGHSAESIRDLLRSGEWVALGIACATALMLWAGSEWLSTEWVQTKELPGPMVAQSFAVMGIVIALRFVEGIYRSAVIGLQQQVRLNAISCAIATIRGVGAIGILAWIAATPIAFFLWQACVSLLAIVAFAGTTYSNLKQAGRPARFSVDALRSVWRFAASLLGVALLALVLTQTDKILLSRLLSLREFGYYALAATVAGAIYMLSVPITQALYPRLCQLSAAGDTAAFRENYHRGAQLMTVAVSSAAVTTAIFSKTLLVAWTQDPDLAAQAGPILSLLVFGNMLHSLMGVPYYAQLAVGWTSLALVTNAIAVILLVPAVLWSVPRYGAQAAAWVWVCLTAGYLLVSAHAFFSKLSYLDKARWYWSDVGQPLLGACAIPVLIRELSSPPHGFLAQFSYLTLAGIGSLLGAVLCSSELRGHLQTHMQGSRHKIAP